MKEETADRIFRCVLGGGAARVVVIVATDVAREAAERHDASAVASIALGRGAMAALLLATLTKDDEQVTVQILGNGPLGGLTVDANSAGTVRAFIRHPEVGLREVTAEAAPRPGSVAPWVGRQGTVSVVRDLGLGQRFTGQTEIATGEIDDDVERYLRDSEQISSALACEVVLDAEGRVHTAAGLLVQSLPDTDGVDVVESARQRLRAGALRAALASAAAGPHRIDGERLANAVLGDDGTLGLRVLDERPVRFACPCSRQRATSTLSLLGDAELAAMIAEDGHSEVTCNFCRRRYEFSAGELGAIRDGLRATPAPLN